MKKLILFFVVISTVFVFSSCTQDPVAKTYACQEYSLSCELQKDRILFLPITYEKNIIDAYGYKMSELMEKGNQWYMLNISNQGLVPVNYFICTQYVRDIGCVAGTNTPTPRQLLESMKEKDKKVRIDTTDLSSILPGIKKAAVFISGTGEIIYGCLPSPFLALQKK